MKRTPLDAPKLILWLALTLGIFIRFAPTLRAGFPLNDGGMFLSMIRELHLSEYALPVTTSYNLSNIPYAYPPLGFYLARLLADLGLDDIALLQFIPALANSIAIYGFYLLAQALTRSERIGAWAALIFALTPRSFAWLVMGGGLTRALGYCFFLLTLWSVYQLFARGSRTWLGLATLFAMLTVLSHPEAALQASSACVLLWLFFGRTIRSALHAGVVAVGTLCLTLPWWGSVLAHHGFAPFYSVLNTGLHTEDVLARFWLAIFPNDSLLPVQAVIFLVALGWGVLRREYFLLCWLILPFLVEPRSGIYVVLFPLSLLTAQLFATLSDRLNQRSSSMVARVGFIAGALFIFYLFGEGYLFGHRLVNNSLLPTERASMAWLKENTPPDSQFVLLTGNPAPELDAFQEWFPVLTERRSLTTFQGTEWTLGPRFAENLQALRRLQACADVNCVQGWLNEQQVASDYIVVRKQSVSVELLEALKVERGIRVEFENETIVLFALESNFGRRHLHRTQVR